MDLKASLKVDNNYTLSDVLLLLKKSTLQDTHVGTLALYSSTIQPYNENNGYGIIEVKPFPLKENQEEFTISCYVLDNRVLEKNQILTILYTDLIFIDNLQIDKKTPKKAKNQNLHTQMSGIVISENPLSIKDKDDYIELTYNGISYKLDKY